MRSVVDSEELLGDSDEIKEPSEPLFIIISKLSYKSSFI